MAREDAGPRYWRIERIEYSALQERRTPRAPEVPEHACNDEERGAPAGRDSLRPALRVAIRPRPRECPRRIPNDDLARAEVSGHDGPRTD
jgi:hypothetical protein